MRAEAERVLSIMTVVKAHPNLENICKDVASIGQSTNTITWNICKTFNNIKCILSLI